MTDIIGITSTIDHIIYMTLNVIATLLWRLDAAIISMSLYSYGTQDWLTGNSGSGIWGVLEWLIGPGGLAGVTTWTLFGSLALMLWGMAKIAKPFISFQPVDIGKLVIFFVLSYVVISQGTSLMPAIEKWREGAGSVVYEAISNSDVAVIDAPDPGASTDPLGNPTDLDGNGVIRGWEAVATTYFLVTSSADLHRSYPPSGFLRAYCLYNPEQPISSQTVTNEVGCSPRLAWDEWDSISIDILQDSYGIDLDPILIPVRDFFAWLGINFDFSNLITAVPVLRHHPENRELGNRQAQAGIARLAMGIIVSIFPMVEANISLMLALAASFIYITLPIALLFGFFLSTESIVNRLFMQFAAVVLRTIIIQGVVALFMLMLMNTAATGSLTTYLGLVGVGLIGGWVLLGVATSTMKETFSQSVGSVSSIWMGSATGLLGQGAANSAATALAAAKFAGGGALLATAAWNQGLGTAWSLSDPVSDMNRSGMNDLKAGSPDAAAFLEKQRGRLPDSLNQLTAQLGLATGPEAEAAGKNGVDPLALLSTPLQSASPFGFRPDDSNQRQSSTDEQQHTNDDSQQGGRQPRNAAIDQWFSQSYQARETQTGQRRASDIGRTLLGEELAWKVERAIDRHTPAEVGAVVTAARAAAEGGNRSDLIQNGRLTKKAIKEVQKQLDPETVKAFQGEKGEWDLAALTAAGLQEQKQADPEAFRQAMAKSQSGWGKDSPARKVPKELGLDPVAAGSSYTALNRFARLADDANLSEKQREQLLKETQIGNVSNKTKADLKRIIAEQQQQGHAQGLTVDNLIAGASAVPATIAGPEQVWTTPAKLRETNPGAPILAETVVDSTADVLRIGGTVAGIVPAVGDTGEIIGEGAAGILKTGVRVAEGKTQEATVEFAVGAARTTIATAPISILTAPAKFVAEQGIRHIAQPSQNVDQNSSKSGHVVEPLAAAPTMTSGVLLDGVEPAAPSMGGTPGITAPAGISGPTLYSTGEPDQNSGFGQELRTPTQDPTSPAGSQSAVGPMAPPLGTNPAFTGVPLAMPSNIGQPAAASAAPPPANGQGGNPSSPQIPQGSRTGGGVKAPIQPPPAYTTGAAIPPATSQSQNTEQKKTSPRGRSKGRKDSQE